MIDFLGTVSAAHKQGIAGKNEYSGGEVWIIRESSFHINISFRSSRARFSFSYLSIQKALPICQFTFSRYEENDLSIYLFLYKTGLHLGYWTDT